MTHHLMRGLFTTCVHSMTGGYVFTPVRLFIDWIHQSGGGTSVGTRTGVPLHSKQNQDRGSTPLPPDMGSRQTGMPPPPAPRPGHNTPWTGYIAGGTPLAVMQEEFHVLNEFSLLWIYLSLTENFGRYFLINDCQKATNLLVND